MLALGFIAWLSWKIATARHDDDETKVSTPLRFWQAASFQLINPKALVMAVSAISTYTDPAVVFLPQFVVLLVSFAIVTHLSVMTWSAFGVLISSFIRTPRGSGCLMSAAVLLVISILPVAMDIFPDHAACLRPRMYSRTAMTTQAVMTSTMPLISMKLSGSCQMIQPNALASGTERYLMGTSTTASP